VTAGDVCSLLCLLGLAFVWLTDVHEERTR
jgi:hypothetical protein